MKHEINIPIYDATVWVVVSKHIKIERQAMSHWFGEVPESADYDALCSYGHGHNFALFFEPPSLTVKVVTHEIFHLTHRILDWAGVKFDSAHHESAALLHGYLCHTIFTLLFKPLELKVEKIAA